MTWFFWAVLASGAAAVLAELNRVFRQEPQLLNAWRSTVAAIMLAFAIPLMEWPSFISHKDFYLVASIDGAVMAIGMILFFQLAQQKSGRVTSMILPLTAVGAYLTWWMIAPSERPDLVSEPMKVLVAVMSLVMITLSMQKIRANDASWDSFLVILPVGIAFGVIDALTKKVMGDGFNIYALSLSYTFFASIICAIVAWGAVLREPEGGRTVEFFDRQLLWASFWAGFWTAIMFLASTFAVTMADNPTYAGMIMAMTPIWLYLYNHFRGIHDTTSPVPGLLIILGALGLLYSSV
jgi:acyl-CoA synthetase (AMP-forming)/AMP-acid ligase II